ncbi:MAG: EVE domain-containing protein, partial [Gammaproteobacteria bacterium]
GKRDTWYATRYTSKMKTGDRVFFWLGGLGKERGIYATGKIVSESYQKEGWNSAGIDVVYEQKLDSPIFVEEIQTNVKLNNLLILRAAQATNFIIEQEQAEEIESIIRHRELKNADR